MNKREKRLLRFMILILLLIFPAQTVRAGTIFQSPFVKISKDGKAFTTNAKNKDWKHYPKGMIVSTGILSSVRALEIGEHYFKEERMGDVPVGKWIVEHQNAQCIHDQYPDEAFFHGETFHRKKCESYYYSGWNAYCADCGELLEYPFIYMSDAAARSITQLDLSMDYYYLCPFCDNLEQAHPLGQHKCIKISWNQYRVKYIANADLKMQAMPDSIHMYNNKTVFEGNVITPATHLTKNTYHRIGYDFLGWNTHPDGTGEWLYDEQEILNLTDENFVNGVSGTVKLYAQWKQSESTIQINPNGGAYEGRSEISTYKADYGSQKAIHSTTVKPPAGSKVYFQTNGGNAISPIVGTMNFKEWKLSFPFYGTLKNDVYSYLGKDGNVDTITALYTPNPIVLPSASKPGSSFGGWFYDYACSNPAGTAGDKLTPVQDMTLYAKWVELQLSTRDNYTANGNKGAADLSWSQNDGRGKTYKVYQSTDNTNWLQITGTSDIGEPNAVDKTFLFTGSVETYTVPYTGMYTIMAYGAQGGNCNGFPGGLGGLTGGSFWLTKGEVVACAVGGQNGFNGGGSATAYGTGGGATTVSTDRKGILLVAGGGGGATSIESGGAGGSAQSTVIAGSLGESGTSGGGGGYLGGRAGYIVRHSHDGSCKHVHTGSPVTGGGCYTVPTVCNSKSFQAIKTGEHFYYGNITWDSSQGKYVSCDCPRCGGDSCIGHNDEYFKYVCNVCGTEYDKETEVCSARFGYSPGCGRTEEYICGYTENEIISHLQSYGGSNYINTNYAKSGGETVGQKTADGLFSIVSNQIGYLESQSLTGVTATDLAAPEAVSIQTTMKTALSDREVYLSWQKPQDRGTLYYHRAESYLEGSTDKLSDSNITKNTLTSGIKGYYYLQNGASNTTINGSNGSFLNGADSTALTIALAEISQYLHLAAVDVAGNISETIHIPVGRTDPDVAWELFTDPIEIEGKNNVYYAAATNTYYVKSDGETPFTLRYISGMLGTASNAYQLNYSIFRAKQIDSSEEQSFIIKTPSQEISSSTVTTTAQNLKKSQEGSSILQDAAYTATTRTNVFQRMETIQQFTLPEVFHGKQILVTPIAGADFQETQVYSKWEKDSLNSIRLMGDSEPPVISGGEQLDLVTLIDRREGDKTLNLTAKDEQSGVGEFYAEISNTDNAIIKTYTPEEDGHIRIAITQDEPLFSGDFTVTITATDNVGNVSSETYSTTEFSLIADVTRILEPHENVFKRGESGILHVVTYGYADRVEVEFPPEMTHLNPDLNQIYHYEETPSYRQEENLEFMIPLYTPENANFVITVRAYKGEKQLEKYPDLSVIEIEGSVLEEIRTRLR